MGSPERHGCYDLQTGQRKPRLGACTFWGQSPARCSGLPHVKHRLLFLVVSAESQVAMSSGSATDHCMDLVEASLSRNRALYCS